MLIGGLGLQGKLLAKGLIGFIFPLFSFIANIEEVLKHKCVVASHSSAYELRMALIKTLKSVFSFHTTHNRNEYLSLYLSFENTDTQKRSFIYFL